MTKKGWIILIFFLSIGLFLGIFYPGFAIWGALAIWIMGWIYGGGISSGNPYKRMSSDGVPDWGQTKQYKEELERGDRTDYDTIIFIFLIGVLWMTLGILFSFVITF